MHLIFLFASILFPLVWSAEDLFSIKTSQCQAQLNPSREEVCLNIGGGDETIGKYLADENFVTYFDNGGSPKVYTTFQKIYDTKYPSLFSKQMGHFKELGFKLFVKKGSIYDLTFGFACILDCGPGEGQTAIYVQNQKKAISDVNSSKKIRSPQMVSVNGIKPVVEGPWGKIDIRIGHPKIAMLASLCVKRRAASVPTCSQKRCHNARGKFSTTHIFGTSFVKKGDQCFFQQSSSDVLKLPTSATIVKAFLSWSAIGTPAGKTTSVLLNKVKLSATWTTERIGYLVFVDVTGIVQKFGNGGYLVEGIENNGNTWCPDGYASWSITVLYEQNALPISNINICAIGHTFEFSINCVLPALSKSTLLWMAVTETDVLDGDDLYINGAKAIKNVFDLRNGQAFDVVIKDISGFISSTASKILIKSTNPTEGVVYMMVVTKETL